MTAPQQPAAVTLFPIDREDPLGNPDLFLHIFSGTPGDYVAAALPEEGLNVVAWEMEGQWEVYWDNDGVVTHWPLGFYKEEMMNQPFRIVKVTCQTEGKYACVSPRIPATHAVIGEARECFIGTSSTAMPGEYLALIEGEFTSNDFDVVVPGVFKADTESISVNSISKGWAAKVELIPLDELDERHDDSLYI